MMKWRYAPLEGIFDMAIEIVIQRTLEHAYASGRDQRAQDELAARAVRKVRPDWSEIQALSAVDWVRSLMPAPAPAA